MPNPLLIFNAPISTTGLTVFDTNGVLLGTRPELNLIAGANITITGSNNASSNRADITITGSSGGGGGTGNITVASPYLTDGTSFYLADPTIHAITKPPTVASGSFTWITTQGSAAVSDIAGGGIFMTDSQSALNMHVYGTTLPAPPYTLIAEFIGQAYATAQQWQGIGLTNGTGTGAPVIQFGYVYNAGAAMQITSFTNQTTFSANKFAQFIANQNYFGLKVHDDGVNRSYSFSVDAINYITILTETRTAFTTPDHVGILCNTTTSNNTSQTLLSWSLVNS